MTSIADLEAGGIWPLQHHRAEPGKWDDDFRILRFAGRVETAEEFHSQIDPDTFGPVMGGALWQTVARPDWPAFWYFAAASTLDPDGKGLPVVGKEWAEVEARAEPKEMAAPQEQKYPEGWSGITTPAINYREQIDLFSPNFDGIVTQHWSRHDLGSPWWDARDGKLDEKYRSRTQSLARVVRPATGGRYASRNPLLALQLDGSPEARGARAADPDGVIGGFIADQLQGGESRTTTGASGAQGIGALSAYRGGPLLVPGGSECSYQGGRNDDGEPFGPAHLWTGSVFSTLNHKWEGPVDFETREARVNVDLPFEVRGHIVFNRAAPIPSGALNVDPNSYRGCWQVISSTHIGEVKKKEEPPPEPPPEDPPIPFIPRNFPLPGERFPFDPEGPFVGPRKNPGGGAPSLIGDSFALRPFYASSMEVGHPALAWHAHSFCPKREDTRNATGMSVDGRAEWVDRPVVLRTEAYGYEVDCAWKKTSGPGSRLRYAEVDTASGGVVDMPPELGIERVAEWEAEGSPLAASLSTSYRVLWETRLAFGTPLVSTGGVKDGWVQRLNGTLLDWSSANSSGTESQVMTLRTSGILGLRNTGGFTSLIRPDNLTASRSHYLPDKDGTLGIKLAVSVETGGAFTAAPDEAYVVDTSGGGVEVTLPAISAANEGCRIVISREGASDVTVVVSGSDTVLGDTSLTLATDYSSINLVAVYNGGTSPRWISQ